MSSNLRNQAPLFTELRHLQGTQTWHIQLAELFNDRASQ